MKIRSPTKEATREHKAYLSEDPRPVSKAKAAAVRREALENSAKEVGGTVLQQ